MTRPLHRLRDAVLVLLLAAAAPASAQSTNWHTLTNGMDVVYVGVGAGPGQVPGRDGIGMWIDGNDLRGNHLTAVGQFGYRQTSFFASACVLGTAPAPALDFPLITWLELRDLNNNDQVVFTRPSCTSGGIPAGVTTGGALPYGTPAGASVSFLVGGLGSVLGIPSHSMMMFPNHGITGAGGGTVWLVAGGQASLPIASTGLCWDVEFTWMPSALVTFDHADGWWHWLTNGGSGRQYWAMSNDELNPYSSNTVATSGDLTQLQTFFSNVEYAWHMKSPEPTIHTALNPAGFQGNGSYEVATSTSPSNPNGGWDVGRHGGVSLSGLGGTLNPNTGFAVQDPTGSPNGGVPTLGYMIWDNGPDGGGLRTVWHQLDWGGILGVPPTGIADALVGPPGTRLPVGVSSSISPGFAWPQPVSVQHWLLLLHTAVAGHPEPDPFGDPAPGDRWAVTNMLPLAGVAPVCSLGIPLVIEAGSVGVAADLSDFDFARRMSVTTSFTVLD